MPSSSPARRHGSSPCTRRLASTSSRWPLDHQLAPHSRSLRTNCRRTRQRWPRPQPRTASRSSGRRPAPPDRPASAAPHPVRHARGESDVAAQEQDHPGDCAYARLGPIPGRRNQMTETSATRTETNREIIRQAFDAWRQGTGAITDVFAPGMVWRIEGHSAASKEYRSKQQFIDEVLAPFGARFTVSEPFRPVTIRAVYADDDTVIVIWDGRGIASDGQPYENSYAWIMKLADGKVIDGTAFYDSISFNDLWARVQPR